MFRHRPTCSDGRMKINEIFYSLQGEGAWSGTPCVFVRLAKCNLRCPFCDTEFDSFVEMTEEEIIAAVNAYPARRIVLTGGEPTLQITSAFVDALHAAGKTVAIETNGTRPVPANIDWVTVSPKADFVGGAGVPVLTRADEVKLLFDGQHEVHDFGITATHYFLQPVDTGNTTENSLILHACIAYVKSHPRWRLSLQTHKIIGVE